MPFLGWLDAHHPQQAAPDALPVHGMTCRVAHVKTSTSGGEGVERVRTSSSQPRSALGSRGPLPLHPPVLRHTHSLSRRDCAPRGGLLAPPSPPSPPPLAPADVCTAPSVLAACSACHRGASFSMDGALMYLTACMCPFRQSSHHPNPILRCHRRHRVSYTQQAACPPFDVANSRSARRGHTARDLTAHHPLGFCQRPRNNRNNDNHEVSLRHEGNHTHRQLHPCLRGGREQHVHGHGHVHQHQQLNEEVAAVAPLWLRRRRASTMPHPLRQRRANALTWGD